ncbi:GyrI-like domain-containing protein [Longimicrobium sp.]|jgi:predicted transcriptional regulator YdeE|uniref:GyrI-like domain-containing protein n=1 Tax=Longimicrobium sp. TaxID=2029185 RepID=UPI002F9243C0
MIEAMNEIEPDRIADRLAMLLGGLRRMHSYRDAQASMVAQWDEFVRMVPVPGQQGATTYGVMCGAWPDEQRFEYMCGVEVASLDALPPEYGRMRIPAQRYAVFLHHGHVSTLHSTWDAIWHQWLPRSGYRMANTPEFERYDERFDPQSGSGTVEIWCSIQDP